SEMTAKLAATPPKETAEEFMKPVPVKATTVPPATVPDWRLSPSTTGGAGAIMGGGATKSRYSLMSGWTMFGTRIKLELGIASPVEVAKLRVMPLAVLRM